MTTPSRFLEGVRTRSDDRHHRLLHAAGFLMRRKEGLYAYYGLAGDDVFRHCDIMCGRRATPSGAGSDAGRRWLGGAYGALPGS